MGYIYIQFYMGYTWIAILSKVLNWFVHDRIQALYQYAGLWFVYYI